MTATQRADVHIALYCFGDSSDGWLHIGRKRGWKLNLKKIDKKVDYCPLLKVDYSVIKKVDFSLVLRVNLVYIFQSRLLSTFESRLKFSYKSRL